LWWASLMDSAHTLVGNNQASFASSSSFQPDQQVYLRCKPPKQQ